MNDPTDGKTSSGNALLLGCGAVLKALRFYSRLPIPVFAFEADAHGIPDFARTAWAIPLAGAIIGLVGAGIGLAAWFAGIAIPLAATLTIATLVIATGAFHEDGLADCCDGFWGGATRERRLDIMKDSRLGTFGTAGLALALLLRILALGELFRLTGPMALLLLIGISAFSRPAALLPVLFLPPASGTGLAAGTPMPGAGGLLLALVIGGVFLVAPALYLEFSTGLLAAFGAVAVALYLAARLSEAKIGGFTGDVLGACQQITEITLLIGLSTAANWQGPI